MPSRLGDAPVGVASQRKEPYLNLNSESRRVSGSGGCHQLTGSYELSGGHLTFGQLVGTMMACPEAMETEKAFLQALKHVKTWKIAGEQLELFDEVENLVARFEAHPYPLAKGQPS
jgi:heat shock protein HslJ